MATATLAHWADVARRLGARLEVLDLTGVTAEECVRRDLARQAAGGRYVGEAVIREMAGRYLRGVREEIARLAGWGYPGCAARSGDLIAR